MAEPLKRAQLRDYTAIALERTKQVFAQEGFPFTSTPEIPAVTFDEILSKLLNIAVVISGKPLTTADVDTPLPDLGVDSLGMADFIFDAEDALGVELDPGRMSELQLDTLRKVAQHIATLKVA